MRTALMLADFTDERVMRDAQQLRSAYALKRTLRYHTNRDHSVHSESVAEHVFGLMVLAEYFLPLEDPEGFLDRLALQRLLLFHDFPEVVHGDVPYHLRTDSDEERERRVATFAFSTLPSALAEIGHEAWTQYEARNSPEAKFAYALNELEPMIELLDPVTESSVRRMRVRREHNDVKFRAMEYFPIMTRFLEVITADFIARGVFWEPEGDDAV